MYEGKPNAARSPESVSPPADLPASEPRLDVSELGPRALALLDWARETHGAVAVTRRGRVLARLVPVASPSEAAEDRVVWDVEAIGP